MEEIRSTEEQTVDNGADLLLEQIDAFREKAKQLQNLISAKERKVKELEAQVRAKETKNQQLLEENQRLQEELGKKKARAEGIVTDVEQPGGSYASVGTRKHGSDRTAYGSAGGVRQRGGSGADAGSQRDFCADQE